MSVTDELAKLVAMRDAGDLDAEQFQTAKAKLLLTVASSNQPKDSSAVESYVQLEREKWEHEKVAKWVALAVFFVFFIFMMTQFQQQSESIRQSMPGIKGGFTR